MKTKCRRSRGFTLAELLIVVAIIAVMTAIAIPVFAAQLEKSREATDAANIRGQYAEVMTSANETGGDVNTDGNQLGEVPLKQKNNDWQQKDMEGSLAGIATLDGSPTLGGSAWVSYSVTDGTVIHFSGGSGNSGSGTGTTTPTGNTYPGYTHLTFTNTAFNDIQLDHGKNYSVILDSAPFSAEFRLVSKPGNGKPNDNNSESVVFKFVKDEPIEQQIATLKANNFHLEVVSITGDHSVTDIENILKENLYEKQP